MPGCVHFLLPFPSPLTPSLILCTTSGKGRKQPLHPASSFTPPHIVHHPRTAPSHVPHLLMTDRKSCTMHAPHLLFRRTHVCLLASRHVSFSPGSSLLVSFTSGLLHAGQLHSWSFTPGSLLIFTSGLHYWQLDTCSIHHQHQPWHSLLLPSSSS